MKDVEEIGLSLSTQKKLNLEQTRQLFISLIQNLLNKINSDTRIRPYLHNYPFTSKNLCLSLHFVDKKDDNVLPPYIGTVRLMFGKVFYSLQSLKDEMLFDQIHEETYEEALKIYNSEKG